VTVRRDVGVVLSGGGVNGVLMELGFLKRLRDGPLWKRIGVVFGTSSGALAGLLAALDRVDDLEQFLLALQPEDTFRPNRLWRLPFLGFHDYALPATISNWFGDFESFVAQLATTPVELVVVATDVTDDRRNEGVGFELVHSSRTTPPAEMAQAILASAAISALVMPLRVGDRIATDGAWVRNFPLGHAYDADVETIVAFRYLPTYAQLGVDGFRQLRRRLERFGRIPPVRALIVELDDAMRRAERGEPAHPGEMIVRLARVAILRNTLLEERFADEKDESLRELSALRRDVLAAIDDEATRQRVAARFAAARFPFRHDRLVPRVTVRGSVAGPGLEAGFRTHQPWTVEAKRALIDEGYRLADEALRTIEREPQGQSAHMDERDLPASSDEPVESGGLEDQGQSDQPWQREPVETGATEDD
jgi:predicted acylesterase/phospholipase RssA